MLIGGLVKGLIAKRLYDVARRPENQERARQLFQKVSNKGGRRPPR